MRSKFNFLRNMSKSRKFAQVVIMYLKAHKIFSIYIQG